MKIGDYFRCVVEDGDQTDETVMVLAQVQAFRVCLINLKTGNRYNDPVPVEDVKNISEKEQKNIFYTSNCVKVVFTQLNSPCIYICSNI